MDEKNIIVTPPPPGKLPDDRDKNDVKEGKALKGWSLVFFILACIATLLAASSIALPFLIIVFGLLSALLWFLFLVVGSIFTIGLMWTVEGVKQFNQGWMAFNDKIFNSGNEVADKVANAIPVFTIIGAIIVLIAWIFMIVGRATDKNRKKYYTAMLIVLGVLSTLYVVVAIVTILINSSNSNVPTEIIGISF